jgi:hypothetical protein
MVKQPENDFKEGEHLFSGFNYNKK